MELEWDFKKFHEVIEEKITQAVDNEYPMNYLIMVLQNHILVDEIDYEKFELKDIWNLMDCLDGLMDADEDEMSDFSHPYYRIWALSTICSNLEKTKKRHCPSPFIFI